MIVIEGVGQKTDQLGWGQKKVKAESRLPGYLVGSDLGSGH
jgi:hypothetical protein